jgi:hypothetical protein
VQSSQSGVVVTDKRMRTRRKVLKKWNGLPNWAAADSAMVMCPPGRQLPTHTARANTFSAPTQGPPRRDQRRVLRHRRHRLLPTQTELGRPRLHRHHIPRQTLRTTRPDPIRRQLHHPQLTTPDRGPQTAVAPTAGNHLLRQAGHRQVLLTARVSRRPERIARQSPTPQPAT